MYKLGSMVSFLTYRWICFLMLLDFLNYFFHYFLFPTTGFTSDNLETNLMFSLLIFYSRLWFMVIKLLTLDYFRLELSSYCCNIPFLFLIYNRRLYSLRLLYFTSLSLAVSYLWLGRTQVRVFCSNYKKSMFFLANTIRR